MSFVYASRLCSCFPYSNQGYIKTELLTPPPKPQNIYHGMGGGPYRTPRSHSSTLSYGLLKNDLNSCKNSRVCPPRYLFRSSSPAPDAPCRPAAFSTEVMYSSRKARERWGEAGRRESGCGSEGSRASRTRSSRRMKALARERWDGSSRVAGVRAR